MWSLRGSSSHGGPQMGVGSGSQGTEFTWEPLLFPCLSRPSGEPSSLFSLGRSGLEF